MWKNGAKTFVQHAVYSYDKEAFQQEIRGNDINVVRVWELGQVRSLRWRLKLRNKAMTLLMVDKMARWQKEVAPFFHEFLSRLVAQLRIGWCEHFWRWVCFDLLSRNRRLILLSKIVFYSAKKFITTVKTFIIQPQVCFTKRRVLAQAAILESAILTNNRAPMIWQNRL